MICSNYRAYFLSLYIVASEGHDIPAFLRVKNKLEGKQGIKNTTFSVEGIIHKKGALNESSEISQMSMAQLKAGQIFVEFFAQPLCFFGIGNKYSMHSHSCMLIGWGREI